MRYRSSAHWVNQISAWILIQALILSPSPAFSDGSRVPSKDTLRVEQPEAPAGQRELGGRLHSSRVGFEEAPSVGLEEPLTIKARIPRAPQPVSIGLSIDPTRISVALLSPKGVVGTNSGIYSPELRTWSQLQIDFPPGNRQRMDWMLDRMVEMAVEKLTGAGINRNRVRKVGIVWGISGQVDPDLLAQRINADPALSRTSGGPIEVELIPEEVGGVQGEHLLKEGALFGKSHGLLIILGTHISVGLLKEGSSVSDPTIGGIGGRLIRLPNGTYTYRPMKPDGSLPDLGEGEVRFKDRFGAPYLAARFVEAVSQTQNQNVFGRPVNLARDSMGQTIVADEEEQARVFLALTRFGIADHKYKELQSPAKEFLSAMGTELGQALRVFLEQPEGKDFAGSRIVLAGPIGEEVGRPVRKSTAVDLFLKAAQEVLGQKAEVVRSNMGAERGFAVFCPKAETAGQEENPLVTQPARGFATRVDRVTDNGLQVAKRRVGRLVGTTTLDLRDEIGLSNPQIVFKSTAGAGDRVAAARVVGWAGEGFQWLAAHSDLPVVQRVRARLGTGVIPVELRANHAMTMDLTDQDRTIRLDTTISSELADARYDAGRSLLYAVGLFHEMAQAAGFSTREAAHLTLALYQVMTLHEQESLQDILHSAVVDHGNTWASFFKDASRMPDRELGPFANIDTLTLEERIATEADADVRGRMTAVRNHRDRWVSWLMGQSLIDLPYDRRAFREAMEIPDIKARRAAAYEVIRDFDRQVEAGNAERVGNLVREEWLPQDFPYPRLVVGRESRAFKNQALLFADSGYALKTAEMVTATQGMLTVTEGKELLDELDGIAAAAPPGARAELKKASAEVKKLMAHLGPGSGRIRQLMFGPGKVIALKQAAGAIQQLRENLEIFSSLAGKAIKRVQDQAVQAAREGVSRRLATGNPAASFIQMQQALGRFSSEGGVVAVAVNAVEQAILRAESFTAAFSVLMQRPSPTGSEKFKGNELEEQPEQEEALRKLVRLGGQNTYMSPSYDWVAEATDIIEAAPMFIYERTLEVDGKHVTVFEVDQEGLERTIRQMADYFARNIEKTMDSEHLALAREVIVSADSALSARARQLMAQGMPAEAAHRQAIRELPAEERKAVLRRIGGTAAWLARTYDRQAEAIEKFIEKNWQRNNFIDRFEGLRLHLVGDPASGDYARSCERCLDQAQKDQSDLQEEADRLTGSALMRRRPMPAFHLLTTEAPGLVEGLIQTVLEEEMSLRNVVRARNLDAEVQRRMKAYNQRIQELGWKVIQEFGYQPTVERHEAEGRGMTRVEAIQRVISDNLSIQQEVARLAVLIEVAETQAAAGGTPFTYNPLDPDPASVTPHLQDPQLEQQARGQVWERNQLDPDLANPQAIDDSPLYRQELQDTIRQLARQKALAELAAANPQLHLEDRVRRWYRDHADLARTTARRETITANKLQAAMSDPRYAYSSGTIIETKEGKLRPTGGRKRYHLIYAPSRVNLGKGERTSVEVWPQWVGVTDPLAAAHAKAFYELMNFNPQIFTISEAENAKVSENQWTALIRAVRNVQAYFIDRLGFGDIEQLAYQFDQRGGLPVAAIKQAETYQAGPTTGYCIPKDPLFKLFVAALQDKRKLSQIGIPAHLHSAVIDMATVLIAQQENFGMIGEGGEWERWAAAEFLSEEALARRFPKGDDAAALQKIFAAYIEITGGVMIYHLTKLSQILQTTGSPSPLLANGRRLHAALWSDWAENKVTLAGEQVNRSTVFTIARHIPDGVAEARRRNPGVRIAPEGREWVHLYGPYKADETDASPPDVRFSLAMRIFMILSGHGKEVALSLDPDGQILARLSWEGFRPESNEPEDRRVTQFLARTYAAADEFRLPEHQAIVDRLKEAFPPHQTVEDVTITVVPGVSVDDLETSLSETKDLLGEEATRAQELLRSKGISVDQMRAAAQLRRPFPEGWPPLNDLSPQELAVVKVAVGDGKHSLVLHLRGPGDNFHQDIQGQDVVVFGGPHPELMALDPAHLRDLMQTGRGGGFQSALVAEDVMTQGRHRVWFDRDIMLWYAAGRGIDPNGNPIANWEERDAKGREAIYRAFGWGDQEYRPLLGTDLRGEVARQETRARIMFQAFRRVAEAGDGELAAAVQNFRAQYGEWFVPDQMATEADLARQYEQQMLLNRRFKPRDRVIQQSLEDIVTGRSAEEFDAVHWLATGGMFLLNGAPAQEQEAVLSVIAKAREKMRVVAGLEENDLIAQMIVPRLNQLAAIELTERKGGMLSVKTTEAVAEKAVALRKGLALEAARQTALRSRREGFVSVQQPLERSDQAAEALDAARADMAGMVNAAQQAAGFDPREIHRGVGRVMGRTIQVLFRLNQDLVTDEQERRAIEADIRALTQGRELDEKVWQRFGGTYENHGILARFFELAGETGRERVAAAMELLYMSLALEKTANFLVLPAQDVDEGVLFRAAAGFFSETLDDHFYELNPWAFDQKRGAAFVDFYDELGVLKPERSEELYELSWRHHRSLYQYFQQLFSAKTGLRNLSAADRDLLIGNVQVGASASMDRIAVQAIGAGAPGPYEQLWRGYNQFREIAFLRNDGFSLPVVFDHFDPNVEEILDASHRVNHVFLSGVGRTHYSRALMEAGELGENIFITRDGVMARPAGAKGDLLQIGDAHFWLTAGRYREALIRFKGMSAVDADAQIARDVAEGRITPKGIRVAAHFTRPVTPGSVVIMHHHYQEHELDLAGYPTTDKSEVIRKVSYDKTLNQVIYNPPSETGVYLPPEIDWYAEDTHRLAEETAKQKIAEMLRPFAQEHGIIVAKGSAESGARNFQRFDIIRDGHVEEEIFKRAVDFIYEVSKGQNVTIQRAIIVTPIAWMDPAAVEGFVERQIRDWSVPVNLERHPKSWVYGTLRGIMSAGMPIGTDGDALTDPGLWQASHPISLNSLQVATNVGRHGALKLLTPEMVRPEFRGTFIRDMEQANRNGMVAMARYGRRYWHDVYAPAYRQRYGKSPEERDATGVPKWWPRYLMTDFVPEPVWGHDGQEIPGARVVDVIPGDPATGRPARFTVRDQQGKQIENAEILRFKFWLLEPNVGIGLWPNYWREEEAREKARAKAAGEPMNWANVGVSDRIVLNNYLAAGEAFLRAKLGGEYFGAGGPHRGGPDPYRPPAPAPVSTAAPTNPLQRGLEAVRNVQRVQQIGPTQVSQVLVETALAALGPIETLRQVDPRQVLDRADQWLADPARAEEFPQGDGISVTREQVGQWLQDAAYRRRVAELVVDRVLSEPLTPPVEIMPGVVSAEDIQTMLPHPVTFGVVTGKRTLMNHQVYPWAAGRGDALVNVVGVQEEWLTPDGKASRAMIWNQQMNRFIECALAQPIALTHAFIVELPQENELDEHRQLFEQLESGGVRLINPAGAAQQRADDKVWLRDHTPTGLLMPDSGVIPQGESKPSLLQTLEYYAQRNPGGIILQPRAGTTEGEGVEWFSPGNREGQMAHLQRLIGQGDVLVSASRGNVTYQGRPVMFRFNVVAGQITSASAVIGPAGSHIASLGRGGESETLALVLSGLQGPRGPAAMTPESWARLQEAARRAAQAVGLPISGIDLVAEVDESGTVQGVVLEANARPGTLIFGETVSFSPDGPMESRPAPPIGPAFWTSLQSAGLEENGAAETSAELKGAATLEEWRRILADPEASGFMGILQERYGEDEVLLADRLEAYRKLMEGAIQHGFDPNLRIVVLDASPGRDRIRGGHLDFPGMGDESVNSATQEEVLGILQVTGDGQVHVANADPQYPADTFALSEVETIAKDAAAYGTKVWDPVFWHSYIRGALAYMLSDRFSAAGQIHELLGMAQDNPLGIRAYFASTGELALPATGGVSSSSALTGALSVGLNNLLGLGLSLEQLAEVDFGEYYLGKSAGAADKTAQLNAQRDRVVIVGSFPERFVETVKFPQGLTVLMAEGPPRLTTPAGRKWLEERDRFNPEAADRIVNWAKLQLRRFSSRAYITAVTRLRENLQNAALRQAAGISEQEAEAVGRALMREPKGHPYGLLRELVMSGAIEQELPVLAGWNNRYARYNLIYRLLKLIPEQETVDGADLRPRKAALYGLSEAERGRIYRREMKAAVAEEEAGAQAVGDPAAQQQHLAAKKQHIANILSIEEWAQDGDRATMDFRRPLSPGGFAPTAWSSDPRNDVSDAAIDVWLAGLRTQPSEHELFMKPGGFERSTADYDDLATEAKQRFKGKVTMRVAAAGMRGAMAVHVDTTEGNHVLEEFVPWLQAKNFSVRMVRPGAATQVVVPPRKATQVEPAEFRLKGMNVLVSGRKPLVIHGTAIQLPNGSWISAQGTGRILLTPGTQIGAFSVLTVESGEQMHLDRVMVRERTTIEGQVTVGEGSQVWGVVRGHLKAPTILGPGTQILDPAAFIDHGVIALPVTDEKGQLHPVQIYDARIGEPAGRGPVVIWGGTDFKKGVTVRPNSILGPYVHLGPSSEAKATYFMGASPDRNDSSLAHRGYGGNLIGIPVYLDGTPLDDIWHEQLFERLAAFRFGRVVNREVQKITQAGPEVRPRVDLVIELDGRSIPVSVRGIELGDKFGESNLKSVSGGRKSIGIASAGVVGGVSSRMATPVFVGPDSLIDNGAEVRLLQAAQPRTYVRPVGATPDKAIRPGGVAEFQGKGKGSEEVRLFLATLRTLVTLARVSAVGFRHANDAIGQTAFRTEIQALRGHFDEIDAFTPKELELLGNSPDAVQVPALARQAEQMRAMWTQGELASFAGLEEPIELPAGALSNKVVFLGPEVATPALFSGMAGLRPAPGEQLRFVVFARDAAHQQAIRAGLEENGLVPLEMVDVAKEFDGDLSAAVADRQLTYFARGSDVHVIFTMAGLEELGRFLQIPGASERIWEQRITASGLEEAA